MKVFLKKDRTLPEQLQASTRLDSIGNNDVQFFIAGQEVTVYPTSYDVIAITLNKEDLQKILAKMKD